MDLQLCLQRAEDEIARNPYSIKEYRVLDSYVADKTRPVAYWRLKAHHEALSLRDVEHWEEQIDCEFPEEHANTQEKVTLYEILSKQYPIVMFKIRYLDYYKKLPVQPRPVADLAAEFYSLHAHDFSDSGLLFERLIEAASPDDVRHHYEERIKIPHKQLAQTFESLSAIISRLEPANYSAVMRRYSEIKGQTERSQRFYERMEFEVNSDASSAAQWLRYIELVQKYGQSGDIPSFLLVFYRSLFYSGLDRRCDETWLPLWKFSLGATDSPDAALLNLFLKMYPAKREPLQEILFSDVSLLLFLKERILQESADPTLIKDLLAAMAVLNDASDVLPFCHLLPDISGMKFMTSLFRDKTAIATEYVASYGLNAQIWSLALETFVANKNQDSVDELLAGWENDYTNFDEPQICLDAVSLYYIGRSSSFSDLAGAHRTLSIAQEAVAKGDVKLSKRKRETAELEAPKEAPKEVAKRAKVKETPSDPARSREQFSIKLSPVNATKNDIEAFFEECALPQSITILDNIAIVELASEEEVLICLSRHLKPLVGCPVSIERIFGNILWMTNYPPTYTADELHDLVLKLTLLKPISIRIPSQLDTSERRFCYMDFSDPADAQSARDLLSDKEVDGYKLRAEISNPSLKRRDNKAFQVYLHNLNFKTDEESIRRFALKFGLLDSLLIPLSRANEEKGFKNNGYAFLTFATKEARDQALAMKAAELDGRTVDISRVNVKAELQKKAATFENQSTVTILGLHAHTKSEALRAFCEEKVGKVARIQLKPSKGMALVEFETVKDSGRADFALEGAKWDSTTLHVGPKKDFFQAEKATAVPRMMPPSLMRRKKK